VGNQSLNRQSSGGTTLQKVLSISRNSFPGRRKDRVFKDLENILSLEQVKAQEEERRRALDRIGESRRSSDLR
jgi:hypothetical protein